MIGAPILAGKAALKTGIGLVSLWLDDKYFFNVLGKEPELMIDCWKNFLNKNLNMLLIGPGLGKDFSLNIEKIIKKYNGPILIDADGLFLLKKGVINRKWIKGKLILTPHPKEMSILIDKSVDFINNNRIKAARMCSNIWNCITVLKGYKTIVCNDKKIYLNLSGNPGMAVGGSGDVLSGIIGSFISQGIGCYESSKLGVYIHGLSGDICKDKFNENSLTAIDIIDNIYIAINKIKKVESDE